MWKYVMPAPWLAVSVLFFPYFSTADAAEIVFRRELADGRILTVHQSSLKPEAAPAYAPKGAIVQGENYRFVIAAPETKLEKVLWSHDEKRVGFAEDGPGFTVLDASYVDADLIVVYRIGPILSANVIRAQGERPIELMNFRESSIFRESDAFNVHCSTASISGSSAKKDLSVALVLTDGRQLVYTFDEKEIRWVAAPRPVDPVDAKRHVNPPASRPRP
jgi:hypothetical protein